MRDKIINDVLGDMRYRVEHWFDLANNGRCESPIEEAMLIGFVGRYAFNRVLRFDALRPSLSLETDVTATIYPQHAVGSYRADFAIHVQSTAGGRSLSRWLAIECDGHDFHERTKEMAQRDKSRDRQLAADGFTVLRFTGSEIYRDVVQCVLDIEKMIMDIYFEWAGSND